MISFKSALAALLVVSALSLPAIANPGNGGGGGNNGGGNSGGPSGSPGGTSNGSSSGYSDAAAPAPTLAQGQADINAKNWVKAIADLKAFLKANSKSADGWNLLGFAYRNHGDLKLADSAYARALKLDPNHTGALEYQGILFIKLGEMDKAKANLDKIAAICGNKTCENYVDLATAIGG